ncbi:MAG TPA: hypothetical protein VLB83_01805, partial [Candidatus Paceibacterota bacterium]|nr:hypothetical protein [Candidatus Paceibacterota bacterium]
MSTFVLPRSIDISRSQLLILGIGFLFALAAFVFPHSVFAATTTETITANTTWVAPDGVGTVYVEAWGGGGGGAGGASGNCCGGGGGGGAYARSMVSVTPGNSYTVVVGIAGTAGANTPTAGGNGGDSMFSASSTILAKGGIGGGIGANGAGGAGGSGSTGSVVTYTGGQGGSGVSTVSSGAGGGGAGDANNGGNGSGKNVGVGGLTGGGDGAPGNGAGALVGITATSTGGGGSGGIRTSGGAKAGGAGYQGKIVISYQTPPQRSLISQDGYIFENDDATSTPDTNTQQAAASTSITSITPGERLTLRMQIRNTGARATSTYGLFYDRNDGIFTKVRANAMATTSNGDCAHVYWTCEAVDSSGDVGSHTSIAIDPSGNPWISYQDGNPANYNLRVAKYVGTGGTGCASTRWTCATIDSANDVGRYTSIAFSPSGVPWISYRDTTTADLRVARYVGSGGTGCADAAWTCTSVDTTNAPGENTSIAFDQTGTAWVSYNETTNGNLRVAKYVGSGGSGCASAEWTCTTVQSGGKFDVYSSIAIDFDGNPWVAFGLSDVNSDGCGASDCDLYVAKYVGSGGAGCTSSAWTCTAIDTANATYRYISLAFSPSGAAWISYLSDTSADLRVARYVETNGTGCASSAWTCESPATANSVGYFTAVAFDSGGKPWVVYHHTDSSNDMYVARYVGSGGTGCALSTWTCAAVDTANTVGWMPSLAFDHNGIAWISYYDSSNGDLRVARTNRGGEILIASGFAGTTTTAITQSHADMLSVTDSANRNDADCLTSGASWTNGAWFNTEEGTY